jgi:anti-sigma B factor antagonist
VTLSLSTSTSGDFRVLAVAGAIDVHTAPDLRSQATELLSSGARKLVVDLTEVDFLDSSALGALVGIHKDVINVNGAMRVVCAKPKLLRIFEITRLSEVLSIAPTVEEAVDHG